MNDKEISNGVISIFFKKLKYLFSDNCNLLGILWLTFLFKSNPCRKIDRAMIFCSFK